MTVKASVAPLCLSDYHVNVQEIKECGKSNTT